MCDNKLSVGCAQWFIVISVGLCYQLAVGENVAFNKLLKQRGAIAQCRASCVHNFVIVPSTRGHPIKFNYAGDEDKENTNAGCTTKTNWKCSMCWDYCENLALYEYTRAQMCNDDICLEGCQQACNFHNLQETQPLILSSTSSDKTVARLKLHEPKVTKSGVVIAWTSISSPSQRKLTYVVLGLPRSHQNPPVWEEIQQTADNQLTLPLEAPKYEEIIVEAFDQNGFVSKDGKKLVFHLRVKRMVERIDEKEEKQTILTPKQIFVSILLLFLCVAILTLLYKAERKYCFRRKEIEESMRVTWV